MVIEIILKLTRDRVVRLRMSHLWLPRSS